MNPAYKLPLSFTILFVLISSCLFAADKANIYGKVADKKTGETLIGVNVVLLGSAIGASTDIDGKFLIKNLEPGIYSIVISYVSYTTQTIKEIELKAGDSYQLNIALEQSSNELKAVEITASANRQNVSALLMEIKNATVIADGISQEAIRRTPDKNTGEVLKRVSGTSVQDNKFVIIRGLNDRYNYTLLNGMPFSTTEPDRKSVSFDIFPANLIDNIIISKTAQPDMPGEFAGGIIQINTRDVPEENSFTLSVGTGWNNQTTNKKFLHGEKGSKDWLGYDDGTRSLPILGMSADSIRSLDLPARVELSKKFKNNWQIIEDKAPMNLSLQGSLARNFNMLGKETGLIAAVTYNNTYKTKMYERQNFDGISDTAVKAKYNDVQYINDVLVGGILNFAVKLNHKNKITWKNMLTQHGEDKTLIREGFAIADNQFIKTSNLEYTYTQMLSSQLQGDHYFEKSKIKMQWGASAGRLTRDVPDVRKMRYTTGQLDMEETDSSEFFAVVSFSPSPFYGGKFYSALTETVYNEKGDITIPLKFLKGKQDFKTGASFQQKFREFRAREFGYKVANVFKYNPDYLLLPQDSIFAHEMINDSGFVIDDITNPYDKYHADVHLTAGYAMMDNMIFDKLRLVWGVRYELFHQQLYTRDASNKKSTVDRAEPDWMPSVNLIWSVTEKINVRFSASRTVARPEFREISQLNVYDMTSEASLAGNDTLVRTRIKNYDVRFEFYPASGQVVSVTGFYKDFKDPIEQVVYFAGNKTYSYQNVNGAKNYGIEFEFRFRPSIFLKNKENSILNSLTLLSNVAFINSKADLGNVISVEDSVRALQGQSPYVLNAGLEFMEEKTGIGITGMFNQVGDRIVYVGGDNYFNIIEAHRPLFDLQFSKRFFKKAEIRFTINDLFNKKTIYYHDVNNNNKFDELTDRYIEKYETGTGYALSLSYRF